MAAYRAVARALVRVIVVVVVIVMMLVVVLVSGLVRVRVLVLAVLVVAVRVGVFGVFVVVFVVVMLVLVRVGRAVFVRVSVGVLGHGVYLRERGARRFCATRGGTLNERFRHSAYPGAECVAHALCILGNERPSVGCEARDVPALLVAGPKIAVFDRRLRVRAHELRPDRNAIPRTDRRGHGAERVEHVLA